MPRCRIISYPGGNPEMDKASPNLGSLQQNSPHRPDIEEEIEFLGFYLAIKNQLRQDENKVMAMEQIEACILHIKVIEQTGTLLT